MELLIQGEMAVTELHPLFLVRPLLMQAAVVVGYKLAALQVLVEQVAAGQDQEQQLEQQARRTRAAAAVGVDTPLQMEVTAAQAAPALSS